MVFHLLARRNSYHLISKLHKKMASKYSHISTGAGFSVKNGATVTEVISQAGVVAASTANPAVLKTVTVSLTAAQIIAMYATPIQVVAAVTGKALYVASVNFDLTGTATQFTGGGVVNVQYDSTANGAGTTAHADIAASVVTGATALVHTFRIPKDQSAIATASIVGKGLYISNKSAAFAAGTGTAVVTVRYFSI